MVSFARALKKAIGLRLLPVIWVVMSVFGMLSGAFDSWHMPVFDRAVLWLLIACGGIVFGTVLRLFVRDILKLRLYLLEAPVEAFLCMLLLTPVFDLIAFWVTREWPPMPNLGAFAICIFVVSLTTSTLRHAFSNTLPFPARLAGEDGGLELLSDMDDATTVAGPRLLARLDPALRAPLVRVQVRNHYVDVVTEAGSERVLMRFADAIAETGGVEGLQVHRSHWVATTALRGIRRNGGKVAVETSDGAQVPVSRTYLGVVALMDLPDLDAATETAPSAPQQVE